MNDKLNLQDLENVTGGTFVGHGYWKQAVVRAAEAGGQISMYRSPAEDPVGLVTQLRDGDPVMVYSESSDENWSFVKVRGVVTGYIMSKFIPV